MLKGLVVEGEVAVPTRWELIRLRERSLGNCYCDVGVVVVSVSALVLSGRVYWVVGFFFDLQR